jgi:hypothetical protein
MNNNYITKDSKNFRVFAKIVEELDILKELIATNYSIKPEAPFNFISEQNIRSSFIKNKQQLLTRLNMNYPGLLSEFININHIKNNLNFK